MDNHGLKVIKKTKCYKQPYCLIRLQSRPCHVGMISKLKFINKIVDTDAHTRAHVKP